MYTKADEFLALIIILIISYTFFKNSSVFCIQEVSQWLSSAPLNTYFRVNTLKITPQEVISTIGEELSKVMYM